jgi:predicted nucleic acid-binding protein
MRCMSGERFTLDTNILIYAIDHDADARHVVAMEIIEAAAAGDCVLTLQSLTECFAAATRGGRMPRAQAARYVEYLLTLFEVVPLSDAALRRALVTSTGGRATWWDALLVATASEARCAAILTEDMHAGGTLMGVRVVNPFASDGLTPAARAILYGS